MNEAVCWLNGELITVSEARISPLDRGLLYGDGLFETMRAYGGAIFRLGAHVERLLGGAEALKFPFTLDACSRRPASRSSSPTNSPRPT